MQSRQILQTKPTKTKHAKPNTPKGNYWSKQSTLGSVVPLAMFITLSSKLYYLPLSLSLSPLTTSSYVFTFQECLCFYILITFSSNLYYLSLSLPFSISLSLLNTLSSLFSVHRDLTLSPPYYHVFTSQGCPGYLSFIKKCMIHPQKYAVQQLW